MNAPRTSMIVVTVSIAFSALLLSLGNVVAESSVTQLTKELTEDPLFSFLVRSESRIHNGQHDSLHVRIAVTLKEPKKRIPDGQFTGQLEVFNGSEFVSSCDLQPAKEGKGRLVYSFLISPELVEKSRFTFSETPSGENPTAQGFAYWFLIEDLIIDD